VPHRGLVEIVGERVDEHVVLAGPANREQRVVAARCRVGWVDAIEVGHRDDRSDGMTVANHEGAGQCALRCIYGIETVRREILKRDAVAVQGASTEPRSYHKPEERYYSCKASWSRAASAADLCGPEADCR
jgi:hypothetical protein